MAILKQIKALCTPALIYFILSALSYISMVIQNVGNRDTFCFGKKSCKVPSTLLVFVLQAMYIGAWTFGLNWLCSKGYRALSWTILLLPIIIMFLAIFAIVYLGEEDPERMAKIFKQGSEKASEEAKKTKGKESEEAQKMAAAFSQVAGDFEKMAHHDMLNHN